VLLSRPEAILDTTHPCLTPLPTGLPSLQQALPSPQESLRENIRGSSAPKSFVQPSREALTHVPACK